MRERKRDGAVGEKEKKPKDGDGAVSKHICVQRAERDKDLYCKKSCAQKGLVGVKMATHAGAIRLAARSFCCFHGE